jgi:hypothetical protein
MYCNYISVIIGAIRAKDKTLRAQSLPKSVLSSLRLDTLDKCQAVTTFKTLGARHGAHIRSSKRNTWIN